jgi:hypothetical protein
MIRFFYEELEAAYERGEPNLNLLISRSYGQVGVYIMPVMSERKNVSEKLELGSGRRPVVLSSTSPLELATAIRPLSRRALQAALSPKSLPTWCSKATRPYPCATPSAKGRTASKSSCSKPKRSDDCPHLKKARRSYNAQS